MIDWLIKVALWCLEAETDTLKKHAQVEYFRNMRRERARSYLKRTRY